MEYCIIYQEWKRNFEEEIKNAMKEWRKPQWWIVIKFKTSSYFQDTYYQAMIRD